MYINPDHFKRLKTIMNGGIIAIVLYTIYLFAQIMGWIPSSEEKTDVKNNIKQIQIAIEQYKQ